MKSYLSLIDTTTKGRYDVTPLFADPAAFSSLVSDLCEHFESNAIDFVVGIDALGFILGTAIAQHMNKGFIPLRKKGKLPGPHFSTELFRDYSGLEKALEVRCDMASAKKKYLIVDEWVETGTQMKAAVTLLEEHGGIIAGIAAINIDENEKTDALTQKYNCYSVWQE